MGKIGIYSPKIDATILEFATSLRSQQNDILLITKKNDKEFDELLSTQPSQINFEVWRPFQDFSISEMGQFLMRAGWSLPPILLFVYSQEEAPSEYQIRPTDMLLAQWARMIPGQVLGVHFFSRIRPSLLTGAFLKLMDLHTYSSRDQLLLVQRKKWKHKNAFGEVIPPSLPISSLSENLPSLKKMNQGKTDDLQKICSLLGNYIFIASINFFQNKPSKKNFSIFPQIFKSILPSSDQFNLNLDFLSQIPMKVLVHGSRPPQLYKEKFVFSGDLDFRLSWPVIIKKSSLVMTAFQDLSISQLSRILKLSNEYRIPLIVDEIQSESLPGLCIHQRTGWIVKTHEDLKKLLISIDDIQLQNQKLNRGQTNSDPTASWDQWLNEVQRMISKVNVNPSNLTRG